MATIINITGFTLVAGNPPTKVHITGNFANCEKLDVWISCDSGNPGKPMSSFITASPFSTDIPIPATCHCGDKIWVWLDCHQGLGAPSTASPNTSLILDCDCCPQVSLATPVVSYAGGVAKASFALSAAVTWSPTGCTPPVNITGYLWTVENGATEYQLTTSTASADTSAGNWTTSTGAAATVPLSLTGGTWSVKVRPVFSTGVLSANCDPSDYTTFPIAGSPPPQCCPFDAKVAPHGVSVSVATTGAVPSVTATFTADIHWPKKCTRVMPVQYNWEVTDLSNGNKYSGQTTINITNSSDPGANWELNGAAVGAIPFPNGGSYTVVCTVSFPPNTTASGCATFGSAPFMIAGTTPPPPNCCPTVTLSAVITGATATFSTTSTWPVGCTSVVPASFTWTVTDKSTNTTFLKTTAASSTDQTGFSPTLTLTPGDNYDVSVTPAYPGVSLPSGCNPVGKVSFQTAGGTPPVITPPAGTSSGFSLCAFLLVASIVLLLAGGVVFVIGWCIAVLWVWIVGAAISVAGLALFLIWAFLCAKQTPCTLMWTMECILDWIVKTAWVVALIALIFGGLPCGLAAFSAWAGWAVIDSLLRTVMFRAGCPPIDCTKPRSG
jgi:hypothetical protein